MVDKSATRIRGRNAVHIKVRNRSAVLQLLLQNGPMARKDIAGVLHLTPATISNATRELLDHGLIAPTSSLCERESPREGKLVPLEIHPEAAFAVGANLGLTGVMAGAVDLCGRTRAQGDIRYAERTPEAVAAQVADLITEVLRKSAIDTNRLVGVGVGVPGIVDPEQGLIRSHLGLGWTNVPFGALLRDIIGRPVRLVNNVHGMTACERLYGVATGLDNLALVYVSTHIGAGLVIGGELYEGYESAAGGLAHLCVETGGGLCSCGNRGCLQAVAGNLALVQDAQRAIRSGRQTLLRESDMAPSRPSAIGRLFVAARKGDALAIELLRKQARYVGLGISAILHILDPDLIVLLAPVLDYDLDLGGTDYLSVVRRTVQEQGRLLIEPAQRLVASHLGTRATILGGAAVVFGEFLDTMPFMS